MMKGNMKFFRYKDTRDDKQNDEIHQTQRYQRL